MLPSPNSFSLLVAFNNKTDLEGWLHTMYISNNNTMLDHALHNLRMEALQSTTAARVKALSMV